MSKNEEISEDAIIAEAVHKAEEAFNNYLQDEHGLEPGYWSKRKIVRQVGSDFKCFLKEYVFDDRGMYEHETE